MDFFEGFLIGRALTGNRLPRRKAASGTALPLPDESVSDR